MQGPELGTVLTTLRERIARYRRQGIGEQDTKAALIAPVLRALGWDLEDLDEVKLEYRRRSMDNPVDYALFLLRTPRLFVEAKALGSQIDDGKWASQMLSYATVAGVEWVALTDGDQWRIYNSHAAVPVEQKLFRVVRVSDPQTEPAPTLLLLAKPHMSDHLIDALWKSEFIDRQVRSALGRVFGPEPHPSLVRLVRAEVPSLTPGEIRSSLNRLRITFDFPEVSAPASAVEQPTAPAARRRPKESAPIVGQAAEDKTPWRQVSLRQVVETGLVRLPLELERTYRGSRVSAQVEQIDRIVVDGRPYDSLSTAAGMARKSIIGSPPGRPYPQTNGWTFWQYRRADGSLGVIDELRRKLFERKVVPLDEARRAGA